MFLVWIQITFLVLVSIIPFPILLLSHSVVHCVTLPCVSLLTSLFTQTRGFFSQQPTRVLAVPNTYLTVTLCFLLKILFVWSDVAWKVTDKKLFFGMAASCQSFAEMCVIGHSRSYHKMVSLAVNKPISSFSFCQ